MFFCSNNFQVSKLLKINISGELAHSGNSGGNILNLDFEVSKMQIGDFIEVLLQQKGNAK